MAIVETLELAGGRRVLRLQSPVDGSPIGEFPCADPDEVAAAIRAARAAQPAWAALDVRQRAAIVPRSPIDWAASRPTAVPTSTALPVAGFTP